MMLQAPRKGFDRSVTKNNIKTEVLGDWLEGSLLYFGEGISKSDVVDFLKEQEICENQEIAHTIADNGWDELRRRKRIVGIDDLLSIDKNAISSSGIWTDDPVRAFFVGLSLFYAFPDWGADRRNASIQGLLFEKVVERIAINLLPGWDTYRVGWSPDNPASIYTIVEELGDRLNCTGHPNLATWVPDQAKDAGLDLVCFRQFTDDREAVPVYLIQCASGNNWRSKVNTPNPNDWQKYLDAAVRPGTGIAAPFVIPAKKLRVASLQGQAVVLDRLRLLYAYYTNASVIDEALKEEIVAWLRPFVTELPVIK